MSEPAAEIISADSMQLYRGLDVITNKVTEQEMGGVPHHLINILDPASGDAYNVGQFVGEARRLIAEISARGRTPILVGGTTYYIQHTLFPGRLVTTQSEQDDSNDAQEVVGPDIDAKIERLLSDYGKVLSTEQHDALYAVAKSERKGSDVPVDDISSITLWTLLQVLDPDMAAKWHFRDRRKVLRSLTVLLTEGKRHSEVINDQQRKEAELQASAKSALQDDSPESLIFWLSCDKEILNKRLDSRVDKMLQTGLLNEIAELRTFSTNDDEIIDYTRGIYQAIGYKEFADYLSYEDERRKISPPSAHDTQLREPKIKSELFPTDDEGSILFARGLEAMKIATRQYAKRQVSWLNNKLTPEVIRQRQLGIATALVSLDTSNLDKMHQNVHVPALTAVDAFLERGELPAQASPKFDSLDAKISEKAFVICDVCTMDAQQPFMVKRDQWQAHCRGRVHRAAMYERGLLQRRQQDVSTAAVAKREARQAMRRQAQGRDASSSKE